MPNAGKSSLFNALTKAGAEAANYPFTTIEPNSRSCRSRRAAGAGRRRCIGASSIVSDTIAFHDIAGLVRGASEGEGLGNQFLANIRETDAILHVVRAHHDDGVIHPEGKVDPMRDIEIIETELIYADLEQAERRLDRVVRAGQRRRQGGGRRGGLAARGHRRAAGRQARRATVPVPDGAPDALRDLSRSPPSPCCSSPTSTRATTRSRRRSPSTPRPRARSPSRSPSRLEAELSELDDEDAAAMREDLGVAESGLRPRRRRRVLAPRPDRVLHRRRGQAGAVLAPRRGLTAWHAAGEIHTDIQKGFVRAEIIGWDELVDAGGYAGARDRGTLRLEGRDYVMRDGDVITVKFTP